MGLTTLPPSCANFLEILEPQPPGPLRVCPCLCNGIAFTSGAQVQGHMVPQAAIFCVLVPHVFSMVIFVFFLTYKTVYQFTCTKQKAQITV